MMIPGELEHLESLVRLARRKRDSEATENQMSVVSTVPTLRKICINKTHRSKTLHLLWRSTTMLLKVWCILELPCLLWMPL